MSRSVSRQAPVVVAMSGGVDSSATAALLKQQGHQVIGITLQLHPTPSSATSPARAKTCCAGRDLYDAQKAARILDIPHYTLDFEEQFHHAVIEDFRQTYRNGETPIPCVRCNQRIKFESLLNTAVELGAQALATGHYARIVTRKEKPPLLLKGVDAKKDQSYYLFATTKEQLSFLRFPLGSMTKEQTRKLAHEQGLANADKAESQDICFVAKHYTKLFPELQGAAKGAIRTTDGTLLGEHEGIAAYTIGQRKGLGLGGLSRPLYVVGIDVAKNEIVVGTHEELGVQAVRLREVNWLGERELFEREEEAEEKIHVKIRSLMEPVAARLCWRAGGAIEVLFAEPQHGVACGQACVFYQGERVLGGGIIAQTLPVSEVQGRPFYQASLHDQAAREVAS